MSFLNNSLPLFHNTLASLIYITEANVLMLPKVHDADEKFGVLTDDGTLVFTVATVVSKKTF